MSAKPVEGYFSVSYFAKTPEDALAELPNLKDFEPKYKVQVWKIEATEYGMTTVCIYMHVDGKPIKWRDKGIVFLEMIKELNYGLLTAKR